MRQVSYSLSAFMVAALFSVGCGSSTPTQQDISGLKPPVATPIGTDKSSGEKPGEKTKTLTVSPPPKK